LAAGTAGVDVRGMIDDPNTDEKTKALAKLNIALLDAVEAILESGLVPMSNSGQGGLKKPEAHPTAPKPPPPGVRELREGLERAEKESVLFGANLGPLTMANRSGLVNALCSGIRDSVVNTATEKGNDPNEAVRDMEDALSCVTDMEFIGDKSRKYIKEGDDRSNTFCTMPVKFKFEDRNSRINFEKTLREHCGMRATISLPKPIRTEMGAFTKAVRAKHPDEVVIVRLDTVNRTFYALRKVHGSKSWTKCEERMELPSEILLPDYSARTSIILPDPDPELIVTESSMIVSS
jgi:hypothetical protein